MKFAHLSRVLRLLNMKGEPTRDRSHVALIAQFGEHCTGNAKVVGRNPFQSPNIFSGIYSSSIIAAFQEYNSYSIC